MAQKYSGTYFTEAAREILDDVTDESNGESLKDQLKEVFKNAEDKGLLAKTLAEIFYEDLEPEEGSELVDTLSKEYYELAPEDKNEKTDDLEAEAFDENGLEIEPKEKEKSTEADDTTAPVTPEEMEERESMSEFL